MVEVEVTKANAAEGPFDDEYNKYCGGYKKQGTIAAGHKTYNYYDDVNPCRLYLYGVYPNAYYYASRPIY